MNAVKQLSLFKQKLDKRLNAYLDAKLKQAKQISPQTTDLVKEIIRLVNAGGKRLRPAFMYYGYKACNGKKEKAILKACCAIELLHTFALIHDDIIDNSAKRRGQKSCHISLKQIHDQKKLIGSSQHFGISSAILAGDLVLSFAEEILDTSLASFGQNQGLAAKKTFAILKNEVIHGEYLDIYQSLTPINPQKSSTYSQKTMLTILKYKSGKYTIERPLHLGATLANAPKTSLEKLSEYGIPLGIAFQIQDDILGLYGNEKKIGKPIDSDLKEGKKTLLVIRTVKALVKSQNKQKLQKFLNILGNAKLSSKDLRWVQNLIKQTGSLNYSQKLAQKLIKKAKHAILTYPFQKKGQNYLAGIADYMLVRKY